jgi:soluble cytochrome b562
MKIRLFLFAFISALALAPAGLRAADDDQTELGAKMEKIGGNWRKVKAQIADASKNDDTLAKLAVIKENMVAAQKLEPELAKSKSGAEKDKFVADYHAKMKEEIEKVDKIVALVKAGKNDEADKLVKVVDQDSKDAHKSFKKGKKKQ